MIRCGGCRCGGPTRRCWSPKSPTPTMSAAARPAPSPRPCSCAASSPRSPGCISTCSPGPPTAKPGRPEGGECQVARALYALLASTLRLNHAMRAFDPRVTPARAELAAKYLEGKVAAARYVEGRILEVIEPQAPLRREPRPDASARDRGAQGRTRDGSIETNAEGWAWGQLAADRYVGWLPANALVPPGPPPTHKVAALRTLVFPGPSIKLPPHEALPLGARLAVARVAGPPGGHAARRLRSGRASCPGRIL